MNLSLLYRGRLSSCNYGCDYCPFAKRRETRDELAADARALGRFVDWVAAQAFGDGVLERVPATPIWQHNQEKRWPRMNTNGHE